MTKRYMIQLRNKISFNTLLLIISLVGVGFYFLGTPRTGDDYAFLEFFKPWLDSQPEIRSVHGYAMVENGGNVLKYGYPFESLIETIEDGFYNDNFRLANIGMLLFIILPRWMGPLISLIIIFCIVRVTFRIIALDPDRSPLMLIYIVLLTVLLWSGDRLNELAYQANYLWGVLWAALLLRHLWGASKSILLSLILGLIVGWWHESLALSVLVGLIAISIVFRDCRCWKFYAALAAVFFGFSLLFLSPAALSRIHDVSDIWSLFVPYYIKMLLIDSIWFWLAIGLAILIAMRIGWRHVFVNQIMTFLIVSGITSFAIMFRTSSVYRGGFWMYYASGLMMIYLLSIGFPKFFFKYNLKNIAVGLPLLLLVYTHWGYVGYYSVRLNKIVSEQISLWIEHPGETRFADVIPLQEMPLICGNLPLYRYGKIHYFDWITGYYRPYEEKRLGRDLNCYESMTSLIPERLRDVTATSGCAMPGGSPVREYKGLLFMPETEVITAGLKSDDMSQGYFSFYFDYGKGYVGLVSLVTSFISEADGKRYCYLEPQVSWYITHFKHVKRISPEISYIPRTRKNSTTEEKIRL